MKIGIITFHASHNYGSMLQAYALQTYLEKAGHKVSIINYRSSNQKGVYPHPLALSHLIHPRVLLNTLFSVKRTLLAVSKWNKFETFLRRWLHVTREYNSVDELLRESFSFDAVVAGSDQIWNTRPADFSVAYFLPFIKGVKKIAFSPSLGPSPVGVDLSGYVDNLNDFYAISVREENAKPFVQKYVPSHVVEHCVDPTLLLDLSDYERITPSKRLIQGKYILYYAPANQGNNLDYLEIANSLGEKENLTVITTQSIKGAKHYPRVQEYLPVGPSEFLSLVKDAEFVCGRSFHLIVFSVIMQKEFYSINAAYDARIQSFLHDLGIGNRDVIINNIPQFSRTTINYEEVQSQLSAIREQSINFLNKSLSN